MTTLRIALSVFAILNVVFWALLAWTWAVKPSWAARLPLRLGTDKRYQSAVPVWARLAAAIAAFWAVASVLYLTVYTGDRLAFVALFTMAAIFLILAIGAAARVYSVLQLPKDSMMGMPRRQQAR
jgi:hypothetical protein